jgi:Na+/H+ antiporter NhaD/arsenite permease-like protein
MTGLITWIAVAVFVATYILLATDLLHKTVVTMIGAAFFLFLHILDSKEAYSLIDWNVIFLLIGMMIIVGITRRSGLFQYVAIKAAKFARGEPIRILILLSLITALFSAFLDNVTTILIIAPVTILIAVELDITPLPFLICNAIASNIGGTATLIGDPPNIIIGSAARLSFVDFLANLAPVVAILLAAFSLFSLLVFRGQMKVSATRKARIMSFDERRAIENKPLLVQSLVVLALVLAGFLLHDALGVEVSVVALSGAFILTGITERHEVENVFLEIEWATLFFFIGLFILVGGLVKLGIIKLLARYLLSLTGGNLKSTATVVIWISGLFSAFVDNIPYVATMTPLIQDVGSSFGVEAVRPLWWALSLGACLGGNGTLVGASANVVSAGLAQKNGYRITFMEFTKYGALFTVISLAASSAYVWLRYFISG